MGELNQATLPESERVEYEQANNWWRALSQMRRTDISLFTAAQGAVLTIIRDDLLPLKPHGYLLSGIAFLIAVIGFNNERRLYRYLNAFRHRAIEIEQRHGMKLVDVATEAVRRQRSTLPSSAAFSSYYAVIAVGWLLLWLINVFRV